MFVLIVVILISVCVIVSNGVSPLIIALFSSVITLPVFCGSNGGCDGLSIVLDIKPGVCGFGDYGPGICNLSF